MGGRVVYTLIREEGGGNMVHAPSWVEVPVGGVPLSQVLLLRLGQETLACNPCPFLYGGEFGLMGIRGLLSLEVEMLPGFPGRELSIREFLQELNVFAEEHMQEVQEGAFFQKTWEVNLRGGLGIRARIQIKGLAPV